MSNFAYGNKREDKEAEMVRERNIDRLRLLAKHEESERKKRGYSYHKYNEREQEDVGNRLERLDN